MEAVCWLAGLALILIIMTDAIWSILTLGGGGPIADRLVSRLWQQIFRDGGAPRAAMTFVGPGIMLATLTLWLGGLWLGWLLIFSGQPTAVIGASTGLPATLAERVYFVGFTLFTLGVGDYRPTGDFYQFATAIASVNGLFLVTLGITYLLPVVSAVVERRQLATTIAALGDRPDQMLRTAWDGEDFHRLDPLLLQLATQIGLQAQRHLAYPILHYFGGAQPQTSAPLQIARLYEALLLLHAWPAAPRPDPVATRVLTAAIMDFIARSRHNLRLKDTAAPPLPPIDVDALPGDPAASNWQGGFDQQQDQRALMAGIVRHDGWQWHDVWCQSESD